MPDGTWGLARQNIQRIGNDNDTAQSFVVSSSFQSNPADAQPPTAEDNVRHGIIAELPITIATER